MAGKFMTLKRIVIPMMTMIIVACQLSGCAIMDSKAMVSMIDSGQSITLELAKPDYTVSIQGTAQKDTAWTQLDQLKTYNTFRQDFDTLFNINTVTQNNVNGKSGCLYVDKAGDRDGNTTLSDAFRNKTFITKYWQNPTVTTSLAKLGSEAYTDVSSNSTYAVAGAINAYFDLLPDASNPGAFNATESLSREQFYTLAFKATNPVTTITPDKAFDTAIGGATDESEYAQGMDKYAFLSTTDKSLDAASYKGSISRAEAIYMVVNAEFPDLLAKVNSSDKAFSDTKNAGDLALNAGFKTVDPKTKQVTATDRWQSYTLAYMLQHPNKGMQQELYNSMIVAKQLGLIDGNTSRWDEPISKSEGIQLVVNAELAKNAEYGYQSSVEYGKIDASKFTVTTDKNDSIGVDANGNKYGSDWVQLPANQTPTDPNQVLPNGLTMAQVKKNIDATKTKYLGEGRSAADVNGLLIMMAKDYGTTLDAVNNVVDIPTAVVSPAITAPATSQPAAAQSAVTQPATTQQAVQPTVKQPTVTQPTATQPTMSDDMKAKIAAQHAKLAQSDGGTPTGPSPVDPNFHIKAN